MRRIDRIGNTIGVTSILALNAIIASALVVGACGAEPQHHRVARPQQPHQRVGDSPAVERRLTTDSPVEVSEVTKRDDGTDLYDVRVLKSTDRQKVVVGFANEIGAYDAERVLRRAAVEERIPLEDLPELYRKAKMYYLRDFNVGTTLDRSLTHSDGISYDGLCAPVIEVFEVSGDAPGASGYKVAKYIAESREPVARTTRYPCEADPSKECSTTGNPTTGYRYGYIELRHLTTNPRETAYWGTIGDATGHGAYPCGTEVDLLKKIAK